MRATVSVIVVFAARCGGDGEAFEISLVKPVRHRRERFSTLGVLFMHGNEMAQHFLLRRRERHAFGKCEQRRQVERDRDKLAHASRAPRLIDHALARIAAQGLGDMDLLRFAERQEVDARAIDRNVQHLLARRDEQAEFGNSACRRAT